MMWWRLIVNQRWNGNRRVGACWRNDWRARHKLGGCVMVRGSGAAEGSDGFVAFGMGGANVSERWKRMLGSGHEEQPG